MEWVGQLITGLFTAGGLTAIFAGYVRILKVRHQADLKRLELEMTKSQTDHERRREMRGDEIDVLQNTLGQAREDIESLRKDARDRDEFWVKKSDERDRVVNDLKSDHTATLLDLERCRARDKYLTEQNKFLGQRVGVLERELADLEKEVRNRAGGGTP